MLIDFSPSFKEYCIHIDSLTLVSKRLPKSHFSGLYLCFIFGQRKVNKRRKEVTENFLFPPLPPLPIVNNVLAVNSKAKA